MNHASDLNPYPHQAGAALITSLIIVFVIAILGVAIAKQVINMRQASSAHYDQTISFTNAESALWQGEAVIAQHAYSSAISTYTRSAFVDTNGNVDNNWWHQDSNWQSATEVTHNGASIPGSPVYIIEDMGIEQVLAMDNSNRPKRRFLRITAKASGKGEAVSYMQSNYAIME